ncbi:MAG: DNA methyltransferase [Prevotella sp.]|nr:DNA methyltransferase [Prevotella sp.]
MNYINFDDIPVNHEWAFENVRSTEQWTHGYHRYPAKFLPNVVKKIIEDYIPNCKMIADLFAGCGTTLVEAKMHGKKSIGTDINPVARLITKVKITPIEPDLLQLAYEKIVSAFDDYNEADYCNIQKHERLDYWFTPKQKAYIAFLYDCIRNIDITDDIKDFFYVCISHILKNCSWWLQTSTKPQRDMKKNLPNPLSEFKKHCKKMILWNNDFYKELKNKDFLDIGCEIRQEDARKTSIPSGTVDAIITSPPYVTSYEYADIHQLTSYWMEYMSDISDFRKMFIGTSFSGNKSLSIPDSKHAQNIVDALYHKSKHIAYNVAQYFNDMQNVAIEMSRILSPNGYVCVVIGNTTIKDVEIKSAEVFYDFLIKSGLQKVNIIKREIPYKLMPTLRDKFTGKFTKLDNPNCKEVYPNEFIIILKK